MIVVADTGPVNYLILSGHIGLIPPLYGSLVLPPAVHQELLHPRRLVNLPEAVTKLRATGIFLADDVVQRVLDQHHERAIGQHQAPK